MLQDAQKGGGGGGGGGDMRISSPQQHNKGVRLSYNIKILLTG